jgi:hypothetical protein
VGSLGLADLLAQDHEVPVKFLIPAFAFAVAAAGCGGGANDGTGGSAGETGAASADGSTAGTGGDVAGSDAGGGDVTAPTCTIETFCPIYLAYCGTSTPGYTTLAECMATYSAIGAADPYKQQCESYHLCLAIYDTGSDRTLHCSHAVGGGNLCGFSTN